MLVSLEPGKNLNGERYAWLPVCPYRCEADPARPMVIFTPKTRSTRAYSGQGSLLGSWLVVALPREMILLPVIVRFG
jgi:hypothetical protein